MDSGDLGYNSNGDNAESDRVHPMILAIKRRQKMDSNNWLNEDKGEGGPDTASGAVPN